LIINIKFIILKIKEKKMKKLLVSFILMVIFTIFGIAQENKSSEKENAFVPEIKSGSTGLLFAFDGELLRANTYNGGIGLKYFMKDNLAIRGVLSLNYKNQNTPKSESTTYDNESTNFNLGISGDFEYYLKKGRVSPYIGAGLGFSTSSSEQKSGGYTYTNNDAGFTLSFYLLAGAELFILPELSLSAEYRLTMNSFSASDREITYTGQKTQITKGTSNFSINTGSIGALTISFYF
jgi:hypothetical protein